MSVDVLWCLLVAGDRCYSVGGSPGCRAWSHTDAPYRVGGGAILA